MLRIQSLTGLFALAGLAWLFSEKRREVAGRARFTAGALMGTKTVLNEFIAYVDPAHLPSGALSERSRLIMTYAMCGFANFGSLGIMIGGLGGMAPERESEIISLGLRSIVAGTLATCMTGAAVGIL
ncbi:MAG: nucleoside transporter C-terminal domain-containing protein [Candidatus Sulfobium sp.]|jgi:CNT family concentrative nucleoside transporter